ASLKSLANTTALSTFFASPAVKIHQIKKHVLFNSRPLSTYRYLKTIRDAAQITYGIPYITTLKLLNQKKYELTRQVPQCTHPR
ncbi:MAG: hypothetical protein ACJA0J_002410, partial [Bdellovibrionota bacterium]